jgi:hypothetical protein
MRGPTLSREEVDTYLGAVDWLRGIVARSVVAEAWCEPSALEQYTVGGVAAHAVHGIQWLQQVLNDTEPVGLRRVTVGEFFGPNRVEDSEDGDPLSASLRTAAEAFAQTGAPVVTAACTESRDDLVAMLSTVPATRPIPIIRVPGGQVPLCEYLPTRILELIVHGDDVVCSVPGLHVPDPPPAAVGVSLELCVELARARVGDLASLRAFARAERSLPEALRVL